MSDKEAPATRPNEADAEFLTGRSNNCIVMGTLQQTAPALRRMISTEGGRGIAYIVIVVSYFILICILKRYFGISAGFMQDLDEISIKPS